MTRPDQIKEELARWRLCFGLLVAIGASLVGWLAGKLSQDATSIPKIGEMNLLLVALVVIAIVTVLAVIVYVAMMWKTNELGEVSNEQ